MLICIFLLYFVSEVVGKIIVPKTDPNYRLSYSGDVPVIVNRAISPEKEKEDDILIEHTYTHFTNKNKSLCIRNNKPSVCLKSETNSPELWRVDMVGPIETRFYSPEHKCLTLGEYRKNVDLYDLEFKDCEDNNQKQIFIVLDRTYIRSNYEKNGIDKLLVIAKKLPSIIEKKM